MRKLFIPLLIAMTVAIFTMFRSVAAAPLLQSTSTASANLSGAEEVPDPGDPDGTGNVTVTFNDATGEVCWDINVSNITLPSVGAHIHEGAQNVAGPVVVPFSAPDTNGAASGCTTPDAALTDRIMGNPQNFYVNVHTSEYPAGAVRGQLMMGDDGGAAPVANTLPNTGAASTALLVLVGSALVAGAVGVSMHQYARRNE